MEKTPYPQKQYFQFAYQTGSDIWTHIPYWEKAHQMLPPMEKDSLVLDIGSGRGFWAMKLADQGFKVLGIDYIESIIKKSNQNTLKNGYADRVRCIAGNMLNLPFDNNRFDIVTDIGTFQHQAPTDWQKHVKELIRVLNVEGYYLNISLSRRTGSFLGWRPNVENIGDYTKFGVHYHFFTEQEITDIFENDFVIIDQHHESYDTHSDPQDDIVLVFTLMQKK